MVDPKKDGKVRMCVDYRDLNRASPKEDFPLPNIDILYDNTAGHGDGFSGYNQIKMAEREDSIHYPMGDLLLQGDAH